MQKRGNRLIGATGEGIQLGKKKGYSDEGEGGG